MSKGMRSTEFWLAILGVLGGFMLIWKGYAAEGSIVMGAAIGAYNLARGLAKKDTDVR